MDLRSQFLFEGAPRWSYGWDNPNHAAAVIASVIPLLWAAHEFVIDRPRAKGWRLTFWGAEAVLSFLLCLTYSRGGILAWLGGMCFFGLAARRIGATGTRPPATWRFWAIRIVPMAIALVATGLVRRLAAVATDAAATNRIELWLGALQLIDASPLQGWGKGNSGLSYMQWVQDPSRATVYGTMVNTYLHWATEFGLISFFALALVKVVPIAACARHSRFVPRPVAYGLVSSGAALFAHAIANFFTTLWIVPSVEWLAWALTAVVIGCLYRANTFAKLGRDLWVGAGSAALGTFILWGSAALVGQAAPLHLRRGVNHVVYFTPKARSDARTDVAMFPDGRTLGQYYGREIRRGAMTWGIRIKALTVYPPDAAADSSVLHDCVLLFGSRVQDHGWMSANGPMGVVFPAGPPPASAVPAIRFVFLPEYDELGYAAAWRRWARAHSCEVFTVSGAGQDARSDWPVLLASALNRLPQ